MWGGRGTIEGLTMRRTSQLKGYHSLNTGIAAHFVELAVPKLCPRFWYYNFLLPSHLSYGVPKSLGEKKKEEEYVNLAFSLPQLLLLGVVLGFQRIQKHSCHATSLLLRSCPNSPNFMWIQAGLGQRPTCVE